MNIKRGEIVLANLEPVVGSEQGRIRPVLIIQNNDSNDYSPTTIVAPFTTKRYTQEFPTNVELEPTDSKLKMKSTVLLNQIMTIDKRRIIKKISQLDDEAMRKVDVAIEISLGLNY